ncbi:MAG TPA: hypothetical protein VK158_04915 [Acidobacteriota bacterium]|nr:hypothetical protein [Acidobacteriota bacterium]
MGKRGISFGVLCVLLFCCFTVIVAADDITVISYGATSVVKPQDLEYLTCIDDPHTVESSTLVCQSSFDYIPVPITPINSTCSYSSINLADYDCDEYSVETTYTSYGKVHKLTKIVSVDNVIVSADYILDTQDWDGGWGSPSKTAYAIWVLSQFDGAYDRQIDEGMRWLKETRQNEPKCWYVGSSDSTCDIEETVKALAYLSRANITDQYRIISDGIAYVQSRQNYIEDSAWTLVFESSNDDTLCNATYEGSAIVSEENILEDTKLEIEFTAEADALLNFTCTEDIVVKILDHRDIEVFSHDFDTDTDEDFDELTDYDEDEDSDETYKLIRIKPACWTQSDNKWDSCSASISTYALSLDLDDSQFDAGLEWLEENMKDHNVIGKFVSSNQSQLDTAFYLLAVNPENEDALDWLLYIQNNDGSFGTGAERGKIMATAVAIKTLENLTFPQKAEVLADAKHYISTQFVNGGHGDLFTDASITQILLSNERPFLLLESHGVISMKDSPVTVVVSNPSQSSFDNLTANVTSLTGETIATVKAPAKLGPNSSSSIVITPSVSSAGSHSGYISLYAQINNVSKSKEVRRIYISVEQDPKFDVVAKPVSYNIYNYEQDYYMTVTDINTPVTCDVSIESPYLLAQPTITFSRIGNAVIPLTVVDFVSGQINATGTLLCEVAEGTKTIHFDIDAYVHDKAPFTVEPTAISLTQYQKTISLKIKNNLAQQIPLEIKFLANDGMFTLDENKLIIGAGDTEKVVLRAQFSKEDNVTVANTLVFQALGHTQEVELIVSQLNLPANNGAVKMIIIVALILIIGAIIYHFKDKIMVAAIPYMGPLVKVLPASVIQKLEKSGASIGGGLKANKKRDRNMSYMMDIISIMKSMDKNEDEIVLKLEQEGYQRAVITKALEELSEVEKKVANIKHEDTVLSILRTLDGDSEIIVKVLKDKGFSESDIRDAISELSTDTQEKEKRMRKDAGVKEDEKL